MQDYLSLVKQHAQKDYAVIVIGSPDIAKPAGRKLAALSEIRGFKYRGYPGICILKMGKLRKVIW